MIVRVAPTIGKRIEIPVHYNAWMRGAQYGQVISQHPGKAGASAYVKVKLDKLAKPIKVWAPDWEYCRTLHAL